MDAAFWFESLGQPRIRLPLRKTLHSLGRALECDIVVQHQTVSRKHAQVHVADGKVQVIDLNSRNGTFVGDVRVSETLLLPNQIIRFGDVALLLVAGEEGEDDEVTASQSKDSLPPPKEPELLTTAQMRVLDLVKDGLSEKQIASRLGLSRHTVHNHIRRIYEAFDAHTRAELMALVFGTK
jgi:DNA-binding CsgD family transcriptional regulator